MVSEGTCRLFILQFSHQCFYGIWILPGSYSPPSPWLPGRAQQNVFLGRSLAHSPLMSLPSQECIKSSGMESSFYQKPLFSALLPKWSIGGPWILLPQWNWLTFQTLLPLLGAQRGFPSGQTPNSSHSDQPAKHQNDGAIKTSGQGSCKNIKCKEGQHPLSSHPRLKISVSQLQGACLWFPCLECLHLTPLAT